MAVYVLRESYRSVFLSMVPQRIDLNINPVNGFQLYYSNTFVNLMHAVYIGGEDTIFRRRMFVFKIEFPSSYPRNPPEISLVFRSKLAVDLMLDLVDETGSVKLDSLANRRNKQNYVVTGLRIQLMELKARIDTMLEDEGARLAAIYPTFEVNLSWIVYFQFFSMIVFALESGVMGREHEEVRQLPQDLRRFLGQSFAANNNYFRQEIEETRLTCQNAGVDILDFQDLHRLFVLWWYNSHTKFPFFY